MSTLPPPPPPPPFGGPPPPPPFGDSGFPAFQQQYGQATPQYAGFGARLGGLLLDALLYGLFGLIFIIPTIVLLREAYEDCFRIDDEIFCPDGALNRGYLAAAIVVMVLGLIIVFVMQIRALGRTGQTWGRRIAGVKVVRRDTGQPIGTGRAVGRTFFTTISGLCCYLGYLWMLWDKDKQTWHDKVVGSIVVRA
jgi:uncharacterized RDD family membrane protein YckC